MQIRKAKYEIDDTRLVVYDARLASRVNKILNRYPEDTNFTDSEALFHIPIGNGPKAQLFSVLGLRGMQDMARAF